MTNSSPKYRTSHLSSFQSILSSHPDYAFNSERFNQKFNQSTSTESESVTADQSRLGFEYEKEKEKKRRKEEKDWLIEAYNIVSGVDPKTIQYNTKFNWQSRTRLKKSRLIRVQIQIERQIQVEGQVEKEL